MLKIKCKHCKKKTITPIANLSKMPSGHYDFSFKCPYCQRAQLVSYEHAFFGRRKIDAYNDQKMVDDIEYFKNKFNIVFGG